MYVHTFTLQSLVEALGQHVSRLRLNLEKLKQRRLRWLMSCAKSVEGIRITSSGVQHHAILAPLNEYQSYLSIIQAPTQSDTNYILSILNYFSLVWRIGAIA